MTATIDLRCGRAEDVLPALPTGSIGHVVTDPPYGQTNESYDSPVAFDPAIWRECYRVTGPDAALVSFAGGPTYHRIASAIEAAGWKVRQMWGWVYRDGMITSAYPREGFDRLAPAMSPIVFATKGKVLLRLEREGESWESWSPRESAAGFSARSGGNKCVISAPGHWPKSVVATDGVGGFQYFMIANSAGHRAGEKTGHPNQKPIALMRWIISKLPPSGPILDPFLGSGTTALACLAEGFDCIGIEREPEYMEIARARLAAAQAEQPLFAAAT